MHVSSSKTSTVALNPPPTSSPVPHPLKKLEVRYLPVKKPVFNSAYNTVKYTTACMYVTNRFLFAYAFRSFVRSFVGLLSITR